MNDRLEKDQVEGVMNLNRFLEVFADGVEGENVLDRATTKFADALIEDDFLKGIVGC